MNDNHIADWKLVPVEPTEEMVIRANEVDFCEEGITLGQLRAAIAAAPIAPCADAEKDAERYRVLRKPTEAKDGTVFACVHMHSPGTVPIQKHVAGEVLDAYCDAAILAAKEKK
jgi:hypothetical protein